MIIQIILSIVGLIALAGGAFLGYAIVRVLRDQFEEMLPNRMVEYTGFIEIPKC